MWTYPVLLFIAGILSISAQSQTGLIGFQPILGSVLKRVVGDFQEIRDTFQQGQDAVRDFPLNIFRHRGQHNNKRPESPPPPPPPPSPVFEDGKPQPPPLSPIFQDVKPQPPTPPESTLSPEAQRVAQSEEWKRQKEAEFKSRPRPDEVKEVSSISTTAKAIEPDVDDADFKRKIIGAPCLGGIAHDGSCRAAFD